LKKKNERIKMIIISSIISFVGSIYSRFSFPIKGVNRGKGCIMSFCDGHSIIGVENTLIFGDESKLFHCSFIIKGNNNVVKVGKRCRLSGVRFWISGDNNEIILGDDTTVGKNTEFATLEGTKIIVGDDCMFSHSIQMRTSDSHSIVDALGNRINMAKDITIGNHCWIGLNCLILKGSLLGDNSVLAARSILTKEYKETGCLIGGSPATLLKKNINWDRKRL